MMVPVFPSTRQTLISQAAAEGPQALALNHVMEIYWQPCYRYVRLRFRAGHEETEDLVQGFFIALMQQGILAGYDPARGPFRPYLRACLDQFVCKEFERQGAAKRGGGATVVALDPEAVTADGTPDEIFRREWQRRMFALAVEDLRKLCAESGRSLRYDLFAAYDLAEDDHPAYEDLARANGLTVTTVTNHLAWARRELRRLVEARLGTVSGGEKERRRELRTLLAKGGR